MNESAPLSLTTFDTNEVDLAEFCGSLAAREMKGLWNRPPASPEPIPTTRAHLWRWETVAPLAKQAGTVIANVGTQDGQRRALQFCNPGLAFGTTEAFFAAYQYLGPRETAPAHRHSPAAIRFMITGSEVTTTVNGDVVTMEPGDLVLTPSWAWHDHANGSDEGAIWLDIIDVVLVAKLEAVFFEEGVEIQPHLGRDMSERRFGVAGVRSTREDPGLAAHSPLMRYPYADVDRALTAIHQKQGGSSVTVDYVNPLTGGPAIPTVTCQMTRLFPGGPEGPSRQTGGRVYTVYRGTGRSVIGGTAFEWGPGDVFVVPSWMPVEHEAFEVADLFVASDRAVLELLGLHREESLDVAQEVVETFVPAEPVSN